MRDAEIVDLEHLVMGYLDAVRRERKVSEKAWGERAFPDAKNPRQKINAMRSGRGRRKEPYRLRLGEFCALCGALALEPPEVLSAIWGGKKMK